MSGRGVDFLEDWVKKHVTPADKTASREKATALAEQCVADAADRGITIDDMEPEFGAVETVVYEAMKNEMDAELEFWKAFAAERKRKLGY